MLKTVEKNISRKTPIVLMICEGQIKKCKGKNFNGKPQDHKGKGKKVHQSQSLKMKQKMAKDDSFYKCEVIGH